MGVKNEELEKFKDDMVASIEFAKATDRQREVGKAWLRFAITYAAEQAAKRT